MAIFLTESSRILVQGITGSEGTKHARRMVASGANIVAGVTPGKGGVEVDAGNGVTVPVYGSVGEAVKAGPDGSTFVNPAPLPAPTTTSPLQGSSPGNYATA